MNVVDLSPFELTFPRDAGALNEVLTLVIGDTMFVLGANGTGKSALLQRFSSTAHGRARRISAHRQTWLQSNALVFSPSQKQSADTQLTSWDTSPQSRWMEQQPGQRSNVTLYDLIDAENVDARAIATAVREGRVEAAQELAKRSAPIATINDLLVRSNLPIEISVEGGDRLMASKAGGPKYGAAELSDGERNALLIAAEVLTAKPGTLLIIDEPERHLHRSIISPLLTHLFKMREDCAFIVATHDLTLPLDNPAARTLLVRSCSFSGQTPVCWEADALAPNNDIRAKKPVAVSIDTSSVVDREVAALTTAADNLDWGYVVARCPVRETPALGTIARTIGLRERHQYESAVLRLLKDDPACLSATRGLFGDLAERTNAAKS